jgi:hypothetical protein
VHLCVDIVDTGKCVGWWWWGGGSVQATFWLNNSHGIAATAGDRCLEICALGPEAMHKFQTSSAGVFGATKCTVCIIRGSLSATDCMLGQGSCHRHTVEKYNLLMNLEACTSAT